MPITLTLITSDAALRSQLIHTFNQSHNFHCVGAYESLPELIASAHSAPADMVLVDAESQRPDWLEDLSRFRAMATTALMVALVPTENPAVVLPALARGACGYVLRDEAPEHLLAILEAVQGGSSPLSGQVARQLVECLQRQATPWQNASNLSLREKEILELLARGYPYKQIAGRLAISINTVRTYVRRLYAKLEVPCRAHAVLKCQPLAQWSPSIS